MLIRAIFFDIYGTILCEDDPENAMPPRPGFVYLVRFCRSKGIALYSASDNDLELLVLDLNQTLKRVGLSSEVFDGFFKFTRGKKKDFAAHCKSLGILPRQAMVIGNNREIDLELAEIAGLGTCLVPTYIFSSNDTFDFTQIICCL